MRTIRIWLLLLLAILLPVRGAVAAAVLCPVAGSGSQVELRLQHDDLSSAQHSMEAAMAAADHASHGHAQGHHGELHDHGDGGQPDKCNLCSAFCSTPPLASSLPSVCAPQQTADAAFPTLSAPAPSFFSDGQERPPRSI